MTAPASAVARASAQPAPPRADLAPVRPGAAPALDAPTTAEAARAAEVNRNLALLVRLATVLLEERPVRWHPGWDGARAVLVRGAGELAAHIAELAPDEASDGSSHYGGVQMAGSTGPWAQVLRERWDSSSLLLELHPYPHDRMDRPMIFERIVDLTAAEAAEIAWCWVRGKGLPSGIELEPRIVPDGEEFDRPL